MWVLVAIIAFNNGNIVSRVADGYETKKECTTISTKFERAVKRRGKKDGVVDSKFICVQLPKATMDQKTDPSDSEDSDADTTE